MSETKTLVRVDHQQWLNEIAARTWVGEATRKTALTTLFVGAMGVVVSLGAYALRRALPMKALQYGSASFGVAAVSAYALQQKGYSPARHIADYISDKKGKISSEEKLTIDRCQIGVTELSLDKDHMAYAEQIIASFKFLKALAVDGDVGCSSATLEAIRGLKKLEELQMANLKPSAAPLVNRAPEVHLSVGRLVLMNCTLAKVKQEGSDASALEESSPGEWIQKIDCKELVTDKLEETSMPFFRNITSIDVYCPSIGVKALPGNMSELHELKTINLREFPRIIPEGVENLCQCPKLDTVVFSRPRLTSDPAEFNETIAEFEKNDSNTNFLEAFERKEDVRWDPMTKTYCAKYVRKSKDSSSEVKE
jgi:hypothetical protein